MGSMLDLYRNGTIMIAGTAKPVAFVDHKGKIFVHPLAPPAITKVMVLQEIEVQSNNGDAIFITERYRLAIGESKAA